MEKFEAVSSGRRLLRCTVSESKRKPEKEQAARTQNLIHCFILIGLGLMANGLQTAYGVSLFKFFMNKKEEEKTLRNKRELVCFELIRRCILVSSIFIMFDGARS